VRRAIDEHYGLAQIAIAFAAVELYELLRYALRPNWPLAVRHARDIVRWERVAHLAWEAPLQHLFLGSPFLLRVLDVFYFVGHFAITAIVLVWLYHRSRPAYRRFRNALIATTVLAFAVQWWFPTAPPRVADIGIVDTLRRFADLDIGSPGSGGLSDPVAAMPSLHAGWALAVGIGLVLYARKPLWKAVGVVYPAAVVVTTIVTGNHFLLDAAAGMAVLGAGFLVTGPVVNFSLRRGVEQSGSSPGS
jgi:hypothetical protein